jgi:hypothetical protein
VFPELQVGETEKIVSSAVPDRRVAPRVPDTSCHVTGACGDPWVTSERPRDIAIQSPIQSTDVSTARRCTSDGQRQCRVDAAAVCATCPPSHAHSHKHTHTQTHTHIHTSTKTHTVVTLRQIVTNTKTHSVVTLRQIVVEIRRGNE